MLTGHVDNIVEGRLTGWAFNAEAPGEHLVIRVSLGTRIIATGIANILRSDLPEAGIGAGDHAFRIELPADVTTLQGLMVIAQSQSDGEIALPIAGQQETEEQARFRRFSRNVERALTTLRQDVDTLREALEEGSAPAGQSGGADLDERLARLENRMESAEVFFLRIDEMMHKLIEEKKTRRKRFLGLF